MANTLSFFVGNIYNRVTYYISVISFSAVISCILEFVISLAFGYIAKDSDTLSCLFLDNDKIDNELKNRSEKIIKTIVQAFIMLAGYLLYQCATNISATSDTILSVLVSYLISIFLTSDKFNLSLNTESENNLENATPQNKLSKKLESFKHYILAIIVQTLICIVGFVLINMSLGHTFSDLVSTTIALSVGSVSGQIILRAKSA